MAIDIEAPDTAQAAALTAALLALVPPVLPIGIQRITATGTYTKTAGTKTVLVLGQAPGGGSGAVGPTNGAMMAGSGSAGETRIGVFDVSSVGTVSCTIGAPGTAGTSAGAGGDGADVVFGAYMTCKPGKGGGGIDTNLGIGTSGAQHDNGSGGVQIPNANLPGHNAVVSSTVESMRFNGAPAFFGGAVPGLRFSTPPASVAFGVGGSSASKPSGTTTFDGVAGGAGCLYIIEFG